MSKEIIQLNEEEIKGQLKELVRCSVEETLNELLEQEAEKLTQAARYERNEQRQGYRSGHYRRNLTTTSGDVTLKVPKLKGISFETAIIERYRRRESSVEEALIEMYLAGVSVRRVEDITEVLRGSKVFYTKRSFSFYIIGRSLLLNHSPCEWFSIDNKGTKMMPSALYVVEAAWETRHFCVTRSAVGAGYQSRPGRRNSKHSGL